MIAGMNSQDDLGVLTRQVLAHLHQYRQDGIDGLAIQKSCPVSETDTITTANPGNLQSIRTWMGDCTRCKLNTFRNHLVFGEGPESADIVFIGEGPGRDEDLQGRPFVGRAGQLLDRIIHAMGLSRQEVYITNVVKCRPPNNRTPEPDEVQTCTQFLIRQLEVIGPKIICTLGAVATQYLLKSNVPIGAVRGRFQDYHGIPVMPTYHPAALLRNPDLKRPVWDDVQKIMQYLGISAKTS